MKKLTYLEKIDEVLLYISKQTLLMPDEDIRRNLNENNIEIDFSEFVRFMTKFVKEGYIERTPTIEYKNDEGVIEKIEGYYRITQDGIEFVEDGGYRAKRLAVYKTELLERHQIRTDNALLFLTAVVAVGAIIPACYYFLEIRQHHSGFYGKTYPIFGGSILLFVASFLLWLLRENNRPPKGKNEPN